MRARGAAPVIRGRLALGVGLVLLGWSPATAAPGAEREKGAWREPTRVGHDLFLKEWTPGAPSAHGGDGLGPVYNDTSCVACHNLGGAGGAGPKSKNIHLLSAAVTPLVEEGLNLAQAESRALRRAMRARDLGPGFPRPRAYGEPVDRGPLIELHAGFRESSVVMVHRYGPERHHELWRVRTLSPEHGGLLAQWSHGEAQNFQDSARMLSFPLSSEYGHFTLTHAQLNPAPLFGIGRIDAIPDAAIEAAGERAFPLPRDQGAGQPPG